MLDSDKLQYTLLHVNNVPLFSDPKLSGQVPKLSDFAPNKSFLAQTKETFSIPQISLPTCRDEQAEHIT